MRGWPQYVDAVTGEPVGPYDAGAVFSHVAVPYSVAGSPTTTWVPVPPDKVGRRYFDFALKDGFDYGDVEREGEAIRAAERKAKKDHRDRPTKKQQLPGVTETYRNAGQAADLFMGENWSFIESIGYSGAEDTIRGFMDGFEVIRGRANKDGQYSYTKLANTKKGREILAAFESGDEGGAREFLVWLFSRNRGKRWEDVNWAAVESLGELLAETCEDEKGRSQDRSMQCTGWTWYPPAANLRPLAEILEDLSPKAAQQIENAHYKKQLGELVASLRRAFKKGRDCLPPQTRKTIERRIAYLAKLGKESWRIPGATICGEDQKTGDRFCGFPAVRAEVAQLKRACEFGYDPNWPMAEGLSEESADLFGLPVAVATGESRPLDVEGRPVTLEELEAIPWASIDNPEGARPPAAGTLDDDGRRMLWTVYESAKKHYRKQGERGARLKQIAARVAWAEVGRHYFKRGKKWNRRKNVLPRDPEALDLRQRSLPLKRKRKRGSKAKPATSSRNPVRSRLTPEDNYTKTREAYEKAEAAYQRASNGVDSAYEKGTRERQEKAEARLAKARAKLDKAEAAFAAAEKAWSPSRSNPKPRNPFGELLDLRARVVELEVALADGRVQVHTWNTDRPALFWSEKCRALLWVHGGKDPSGFIDARTSGPVAARHRKWHGSSPTEAGELELPIGPLAKLGPALRIVYFAERYRDGRPRHHDFAGGVAAYAQKSRGARVFTVRGGRLTLNARGLVF